MSLHRILSRALPFLFVTGMVYLGAVQLQEATTENGADAEEPGYFEQWFNEKKAADGTIPAWQHARWAAWDRSLLKNRAGSDIIDSVVELGPFGTGGRTRALWVDPRNDNVILAAGISGGVWRSENGGVNWTQLNDQETSLMPSCFAHNPFNPDVIYYGTGEGRANSADVDGNGIYKSEDGGKTFSVIPSTVGLTGFETIWDIKHSMDDSNTLFAGTNSQGLQRSTDGGKTWEQVVRFGSGQINNILVLPGNRVLASCQGSPVMASDSAGKKGTFYTVSMPGFPGSGTYRRIQMANCRKFPDVVYALFEGYNFSDGPTAFYKSSNGGRTWKKQNVPNSGAGYQAYCVMLGVNPVDSNVVVAGGVNIAQSNNGGTSWANKSTGHSDHHAFAGFSTNTAFFLVGTDGGVYKYKYSSSAVNADLNKGYKVTQFYAGNFGPGGRVAISGAQDNGTHVTTGELKSQQFYGADGAYAHIGLQDGTIAYFSTQNEGIRRFRAFNPNKIPSFSDDISNSSFSTDGVNFINAYAMAPGDQYQLYYRTNKYIYRSADGGDGWEVLSNLRSGMKAFGISDEENPVLYFGGSAAQLYRVDKARDAAKGTEISFNNSFPTSITSDFINAIVVHPNDRNTVFIAFSNYSNQPRVWRISGLDSSKPVFKNVSGNLPQGLPVNYVAVDPQNPDKNLFAGTDFGLYYSTDGGTNWTKETRIPNVAVHEVKMRKDRKLFLFTHGRGMWYISLKEEQPNATSSTAAPKNILFPNPAANQITVQLQASPVNAAISLFNMEGKEVFHSSLTEISSTVNLTSLSNGFYFARIENAGRFSTSKILIRR